MTINSLKLQEFTVFEDLEIQFSPGINVFIGENGTGKTHLLKVLYSFCASMSDPTLGMVGRDISLESGLFACFGAMRGFEFVRKSSINNMSAPSTARLEFHADEVERKCMISQGSTQMSSNTHDMKEVISSIFIPSKDMLTHARGLLTMAERHSKDMPFDKTLLDIIRNTETWKVDEPPKLAKNITPILEEIIGGTISQQDGDFYVLKPGGQKIRFSLEAEGIKKFGLIWQLLMTEGIKENSILFWDEPEANINPKLIPCIVKILLELAKHGVQIFIATHDYFLPQYSDVLSVQSDGVKFHSLYKTEENGVKCETSDKFSTLTPNNIIDEKIKLYDAEIEKVMQ